MAQRYKLTGGLLRRASAHACGTSALSERLVVKINVRFSARSSRPGNPNDSALQACFWRLSKLLDALVQSPAWDGQIPTQAVS